MNIFYYFLLFNFWGPGEAYVESSDTKVSWRPHHTGDIKYKEKEWIISFSYVKTLTSLAIWGPGGGGLQ